MPIGSVKWYDKDKGFGFAASEDGQEFYLPASALPAEVQELRKGTRIEFGIAEGRRGAQAMGVRILDRIPSIAKAKRANPRELAPMVQDLSSVLDDLSGQLSKGKYPETKKGQAIAAALRRVADQLEA